MLKKNGLFVFLICTAYVAARLWRLDDSCLWFDEIFSVHAAEHPWNSIFWFVAQDLIHPPLFYVLLKLWIGVGGESVFWIRLLPVLFSVLALVPCVYLCKELKFGPSTIYLALALLAVNGALIKYTQTLRMYSMLMFMALLSMWLFARYFSRGKSLTALIIVNVLLIYTHYFGWLVIGSEILAILIFQRIKWRGTLLMFGVAVVSFVPWLMAVWQAERAGSSLAQNIAWQARPGLRELLTFFLDLVEPFYFQASNAEPASIYLVSVPMLIVFTAAMIEYVIKWARQDGKRSAALLGIFVLVPLIVSFAASWILPHSVWGTRHLIVVLPPLTILFADAVRGFHLRAVRIGAILLIGLLCVLAFVLDVRRDTPRHVWCAWDDVASEIKAYPARSKDPTTVYAFENLVAYHLWFALRDSDRLHVAVVKGVDVKTADETYFLPRGFDRVRSVELEEIRDDELWIAFRDSTPAPIRGVSSPILKAFEDLGYVDCSIEAPEGKRYGTTEVFSLKMTRSPAKCP